MGHFSRNVPFFLFNLLLFNILYYNGCIISESGVILPRILMKLSPTSVMHYLKLVGRSAMFLLAVALYFLGKVTHKGMFAGFESSLLPFVYTVIFSVEMLLRFFPSRLESMGCQKHFKQNFVPRCDFDRKLLRRRSLRQITPVLISWLALNALIFALYFAGLIDWGILILISLAYSVCDMICILFFCPFESWMMMNKCCGSCRIYNWDFIMMFTPLIFFRHPLAFVLVGMSLLLLLRWEIGAYLTPERYFEDTNANLSCANCTEHLCHHKKQLKGFHKKLIKMGYQLIRK